MKTLWLMNAERLAALGAAPSFLFVSDELPYAQVFDICEIAYHAHAILGSIPLIQMVQLDAREAVTTVAVLDFSHYYRLTILYSTCNTGFRFEAVVASATGA